MADSDEQIKISVQAIVDNKDFFNPNLQASCNSLLHSGIDSPLFIQAKQYITRALMWMNPSSDEMKQLFSIIRVNEIVPIMSKEFGVLNEVLFEDYSKKALEYMEE